MGRERYGRIEGRRGQTIRRARLSREPLCRICLERDIVRQAVEVDHIKPLSEGGLDTDDNCQSLCKTCHEVKSSGEKSERPVSGGAANHPEWLPCSAIPLTIVCGPPASGKTTYVQVNAVPGDTVIDLDAILAELDPSYKQWADNKGDLNAAIRLRNARLADLSRATCGTAWFIVAAPSRQEREWWKAKLGGEILLLDPGQAECLRRCKARGTPKAATGVVSWYEKAAQPWSRKPKLRYGLDGWPV